MSKLFDTMEMLLPNLSSEELIKIKNIVDELAAPFLPKEVLTVSEQETEFLNLLDTEKLTTQVTPAIVNTEIANNQKELIEKFGYLPSSYQLAVIDWVKKGNSNVIIGAIAGSGKSSTLKMLTKILTEDLQVPISEIKLLVFNTKNAKDLIESFGKEWQNSIQTLNAFGWSLIKSALKIKGDNYTLNNFKYHTICEELGLILKDGNGKLAAEEICGNKEFLQLIDLVRQKLINLNDLEELQQLKLEYQLTTLTKVPEASECLKKCLDFGDALAYENKVFDFVDQLYLPCFWELTKKKGAKKYKKILIDECQDLSPVQSYLVSTIVQDDGQVIAVGDRKQAIYGFAGAGITSFNDLKTSLNATELPLSICYRCAKKHISLVNQVFPDIPIEAFDKKEEGILEVISDTTLESKLQSGDIILSRKTAPLVSLCLKLISQGVSAKVKGKDIGKSLCKDLEEISKLLPSFSFKEFPKYLAEWHSLKLQKIAYIPHNDALIESLADKVNALSILYQANLTLTSVKALCSRIESLFSDDVSPITLQTVHKSKGSEADRVFIIRPNDFPLVFEKSLPWQVEQEYNLLYVALTRAKQELYLVTSEDDKNISWLPSSFI